jgi:hypothetical protein
LCHRLAPGASADPIRVLYICLSRTEPRTVRAPRGNRPPPLPADERVRRVPARPSAAGPRPPPPGAAPHAAADARAPPSAATPAPSPGAVRRPLPRHRGSGMGSLPRPGPISSPERCRNASGIAPKGIARCAALWYALHP